MSDKKKTSYSVSKEVLKDMDVVCKATGISKSNFVTMAICCFTIKVMPSILTPRKRKALIQSVIAEFQKVADEALEKA